MKYNEEHWIYFGRLVVTTVTAVLPIVAIVVLYFVRGALNRLYTTIGLFLFTTARVVEIIAATGA
jgi:hypothetical protein